MNQNKGFTLIELLVVIAIIGILAAVILASLNTAREKGKDGAIEADLTTISTQAELFYEDNGESYGTSSVGGPVTAPAGGVALGDPGTTLFDMDQTTNTALNAALLNSGSDGQYVVGQDGQSWAVEVPLASDTTKIWCTDWTGFAGELDSSALPLSGSDTADASCPSS